MRIGILQTGMVNEALAAEHGEYPGMLVDLMRPLAPDLEYRTWATVDGALPDSPHEADAWMITGSKHGVYDDLPWIEPLKEFLRDARAARVPVIGVCFGHQILAEALGGRAEKSDRGWGVGVHDYQVHHRPDWMAGLPERIAVHAMHQDQVTALPEDATVLASSPFCPNAMVAWGDPELPDAVSIQPHPEYEVPYARALAELRAAGFAPEVAEAAFASYGSPVHNAALAEAFLRYLRAATARREAGAPAARAAG